jgi:thermostable 8-oxoguanine DNA glycosylase
MAAAPPIRTARSYRGRLARFDSLYKHQPTLTPHLDSLPNEPLSQATVNEIVLWKVNRYVRLTHYVRNSLYALRTLRPKQHRRAERVLRSLLRCHGVDLPMASTFLRFQNADVFQIIDRHAYRAVYGNPYPHHSATPDGTKVSTYFEYLDALHDLAESSGAAFRDLDRILYEFDKDKNPKL